ncbi:endo alpha-1,4 polygalactosaminidase [Phytohabitans sp. LJ34]|uniref:endo alpha-1,4 polygalactosaminidase n=1 Tax=Phytohabitans sp. LJ34 TaxID=3452217 RepID=UPI003F8C2EA3
MRPIGVPVIAVLAMCGLGGCSGAAPSPSPSAPSAQPSPAAVRPSLPSALPSSGAWRAPPANAVFDYQIGGVYPPAAAVGVVDRDRAAAPVPGRYNICYVNAFQTQPGENAWWQAHHPTLLLKDAGGRHVEDPDWPGERLLDIADPARREAVAGIVGGWFADCADRGYQAVEPDNLDSWTRSAGLLSRADAEAYARLLVRAAHAHGLAIGQKNTPELGDAGIGFDFAIAEECAVYDECDAYTAAYGDRLYEIEYTDNGTDAYREACTDHGARVSVILRDRDVTPTGDAAYHYEYC